MSESVRGPTWTPILLLTVVVAAAFAGVRQNELVDWDDLHLLVANDRYKGLAGEHLRWMFTTTLGGHYQPLTWLSFAADHIVWGGVSAAGMHLTNLSLHMIATALFFVVARRLLTATISLAGQSTGVLLGAIAAALLFAVHPLRVESVAWATERRDVLSGALLLTSVLLYLQSTKKGGRRWLLAASVAVFGLSLLSKAAGITLPFVLLAIDWYPLQRRRTGHHAADGHRQGAARAQLSPARLFTEKVPFMVLAVTIAAVALHAQGQSGALRSAGEHPIGLRLSQAAFGIIFYLGKMLWPANLIPLYEQDPRASALDVPFLLCGGAVVAIFAAAWLLRHRVPAFGAAWICYLLLLAPVLGLAQSGPQIAADRYTYLASMPWAVLVGGIVARCWTASELSRRRTPWRAVIVSGVAAIGLACVLMTREQVKLWRDSYTLWTTVLQRAPQTGLAHANLASLLLSRGEVERSRHHARAALDRLPGNRLAHQVLGRASLVLGDYPAAQEHLEIALQIARNLGRGDVSSEVALAAALAGQGRAVEADAVYRQVIKQAPGEPDWRMAYAGFLAGQQRLTEAETELREVLRLDDAQPDAWARLGILLREQGKWTAARDAFEQGLARAPNEPRLQVELAWLLATCPDDSVLDSASALALARAARHSVGEFWPRANEALAAALAQSGDFIAAGDVLTRAMPHAETDAQRERMEEQLAAYRAGRPFREP